MDSSFSRQKEITMDIFDTDAITEALTPIISAVTNNIGGVLVIFAAIVGLAVVLALIDQVTGTTSWRSPSTGRSYKVKR